MCVVWLKILAMCFGTTFTVVSAYRAFLFLRCVCPKPLFLLHFRVLIVFWGELFLLRFRVFTVLRRKLTFARAVACLPETFFYSGFGSSPFWGLARKCRQLALTGNSRQITNVRKTRGKMKI